MVQNNKQEKPSFIDYVYVLVKWRKMIIINFLVVSIIAAGVSLIIPKWYRASSTIMPPAEDTTPLGGLTSLMTKLPVSNLGNIMGMSQEGSRFLAMLNSRTIMEATVKKFNLIERYNTENMEETIEQLRNHIKIDLNEEGTITVSAEAGTPFLSSKSENNEARNQSRDMANFIIQELDKINKQLKTNKAHNNRLFIEKRYLQNIADIRKAEIAFKEFQKKYGTISIEEQTQATISVVSELKAQIIAKEIEFEALNKYTGSNNSEVIRVKKELAALQNKFEELQKGNSTNVDTTIQKQDLLLTLNDIPDLGIKYLRLFRELKLQESILEFLLPIYEQAKIEEAKNVPTLQILDKAVSPVLRVRPKRSIFVIFWAFISLLISITFVFSIEHIQNMKQTNPEKYNKINHIITTIKNDIKIFKTKK